MKLAILSRSLKAYSTRRLKEAALDRGFNVKVLDTLKFAIDLKQGDPDLYFRQKQLSDYDAVLPRIGASITYYGTAVVRQFQEMDVFCANTAHGIANSRDKLRSLQILARHHIGIPETTFVRDKKDVLPAIERVGGAPVIIKLVEGAQGIGVLLAESVKAAESSASIAKDACAEAWSCASHCRARCTSKPSITSKRSPIGSDNAAVSSAKLVDSIAEEVKVCVSASGCQRYSGGKRFNFLSGAGVRTSAQDAAAACTSGACWFPAEAQRLAYGATQRASPAGLLSSSQVNVVVRDLTARVQATYSIRFSSLEARERSSNLSQSCTGSPFTPMSSPSAPARHMSS